MNPFSIFIPVCNEEKIIIGNTRKLLGYLDTLDTPYEIILAGNGSTDSTDTLASGLQNEYPQVKCISIPCKGIGSALNECISVASYENIITVDMDLSICLDFIESASALLSEGFDVIVGAKRQGTQKRSLLRKTASMAFIVLTKKLLGMDFNDYAPGAKAYKKRVLESFQDKLSGGTFYVVEILCIASKSGYKIIEIPVNCDDSRKSKFNLLHEGIYRFGKLFLLWLTKGCARNIDGDLTH